MTIEEIKIMQMFNQHLIEPADKMTVVKDLCGIQSQFMVNAFHSLKIRCSDYDEASMKDGLVKNWTIRGTIHVFAESDLPLFMHCNGGVDYRRNEWNGYTFWNQRECWALTPERQKYFSEVILGTLKERSRTREELKEICRAKGMNEAEESSMFDQWGGGIRELCERGFMNYVVQEKKAYCLSPDFEPINENTARLELARRYFSHIAPATVHDAAYFFGCRQSDVKEWLRKLPVTSMECNGNTYYYIASGKNINAKMPDCIFLAGFDQLMLGYQKKESLYLSAEYLRGIFNLAGIVMPAVLLHGRVVGRWKKKGKKLTIVSFETLENRDKKCIEQKAYELWEDGIVLKYEE